MAVSERQESRILRQWWPLIAWVVLALLAGAWFMANAMAEREKTLRDAETRALALVELAMESVHRLIEGADTALTAISVMIGPEPDWDALSQDHTLWQGMRDMGASLSAVPRLLAIDQDGMTRIHSAAFGIGRISVTDRDYFIHLGETSSPSPYMGVPIVGRYVAMPLLPFSRRLSRADGSFAGVVLANIRPQAFLDLFASMRIDDGGFFNLLRRDGITLVRFPEIDGAVGQRIDLLKQHPALAVGHPSGVAQTVSPLDGTRRITAFKTLDRYDLILVAGLPMDQVLAPWWRQTRRMALVVGTGFMVLTGLLVLLLQRRHAEADAQERLRASEESLRQAQTIAKLGYYVYDMVSDSWVSSAVLDDIFGIDATYHRSAEGWLDLVVPPMRPDMALYLQGVQAGSHEFDREYQILRPRDGRRRWLAGLGKVERGADGKPVRMVGTIQDITDQKLAEERLLSSEEKLRSLFELAPLGIALTDMEGHFLEANSAFLAIIGHSLEQLRQISYWALTPESYARQEAEQLESLRMTGHYGPYEKEYIRRTGELVPVVLNGVRVTGGDGTAHIWSIVEDITGRKAAHQALREKAEELARSNTELEQFAYVASHDLREPLRMVSSYVDLLGRRYADKLDADAKEFIAFAKDGATRMDHLVLDLLEYSRIGRLTRPMTAVSLDITLDRVSRALRTKIEEAGGMVVTASLPVVLGDSDELMRLLQNLIGNAIKYRDIDRPPVVSITAERRGPFWELIVADNGIGIDAQYFDRVFLIFQRLHKRGDYEGTGIGLAICKKITEHHGGRIWLTSTPGEGSAFHITLPAADEQAVGHLGGGAVQGDLAPAEG